MDLLTELARRLERLEAVVANLNRVGVVTAVDQARARVRVRFDEADGVVSYWLPVGQAKTKGDREYWLPDVGTEVFCGFLSNGLEAGAVLRALYSTQDPPPVQDKDKWRMEWSDGSYFEYDRRTHKLLWHIAGEVELKATGSFTINGQPIHLNPES